jgi:hypothetical protein
MRMYLQDSEKAWLVSRCSSNHAILSDRYSLISSFHLSARDRLCFSKSERAHKEASIGDDVGQH